MSGMKAAVAVYPNDAVAEAAVIELQKSGFGLKRFSIAGKHIDQESDAAPIAATKCGDVPAFEEFVLRHIQRVFAVAQRITKNREDAKDVA